MVYSKRKEFVPVGGNFFSFRVVLFSDGILRPASNKMLQKQLPCKLSSPLNNSAEKRYDIPKSLFVAFH